MRHSSRVRHGARFGVVAGLVGGWLLVACGVDYVASDAEYRCKRDPPACSSGAGGTGGDSGLGGSAGDGGAGGAACPAGPGPPKVLVQAFCIGATEVTYNQYQKFVAAKVPASGQGAECSWNTSFAPTKPLQSGGCSTELFDPAGYDSYPVTCIDWCDATAYCRWAGARLCGGIGGAPLAATDFADATKSEWFAACVGASVQTIYPYGDTYSGQACNGADNTVNAAVVVQGMPLCHGSGQNQAVFDLSGNVSEWEGSCATSAQLADCRVRGGSFKSGATALRCDADQTAPRTQSNAFLGFRCCADPI